MATWKPFIELTIPSDISAEEHPEITKTIAAANARIAKQLMIRKEAAVEVASIALSASGVGACGFPKAIRLAK